MKPSMYVDLTTSLERACFDYLFIEDTAMVEDTYNGTMEASLKYGYMVPKNDPLPYIPLLAAATRHIGIIPTVSTTQYPPYLAARMLTTLDHVTEGRIGANIVTSVSNRASQNYGFDVHPEHDLRYEMAEEWMEVVSQLWDSWDPDAVVVDQDLPMYADYTKVHPIEFEGKFFKCRGPLNTAPGPQRRPVIGQAGNSIPGRELAAKHADTLLSFGNSVEQMKAFRDDLHQRLIAAGRKPTDCKVLYLITPILGQTDAEAQARAEDMRNAPVTQETLDSRLWGLSYGSGGEVDFGQFDLDAPVPEVTGNGEQSSMANFRKSSEGKTLREAITSYSVGGGLNLVGSPETVASKMEEVMDAVGGDGFLLYPTFTRHAVIEICDGLVPVLKKRGLTRTSYTYSNFRDNLLEF
jgi:FMN-dependent oxidoreductase (nitrilotriacetate monooxygenase family)